MEILELLRQGNRNVNAIAVELGMPQSTVATNIILLEKAGLVTTRGEKAIKGSQKVCTLVYDEYIIKSPETLRVRRDVVEVEMPIGLFIEYEVSPPCGMCSPQKIIGYLDSPSSFLEPDRVRAGLLWFERGYVEYQFPNNAYDRVRDPRALEIVAELSSEAPGTNPRWPSDITFWVNGTEIGSWTSPGDYGDKRGVYTPEWWKLSGSQYGLQKSCKVTESGSFVDGVRVSESNIHDLQLMAHHSVRVRIGIKRDANHVGGINIFGKGFGNYDQDLILRLYL